MLFVCDSHSQRMVYIHLYVSVQTFLFALKTNQLGDEQKDCNETDNHRIHRVFINYSNQRVFQCKMKGSLTLDKGSISSMNAYMVKNRLCIFQRDIFN